MNVTAGSLEELRRLLEAKEDSAYAQLLALVRGECPCTGAFLERGWGDHDCISCYANRTHRTFHLSDCARHNEPAFSNGPCDCGCCTLCREGCVTRTAYWQAAPEGALWGALQAATYSLDRLASAVSRARFPLLDQSAVDALVEALR